MKFGHPENFFWLLALVPLLGVLIYSIRAKRIALERLGDKWLMMDLTLSVSRVKQIWKTVLLFTAAVFLLIAFMAPQVGERLKEVKRKGIDVVIALDISNSMRAEDVKPSRLEKAKFEISAFLDRLGGDRVGLVVFAGESFLQCPMTLDKSALRLFLDIVTPEAIQTQGTNFAAALTEARKAFQRIEQGAAASDGKTLRNKAIIVFSDGEDHQAGIEEVLTPLIEEKTKVFTVGVGTLQPSPMPIPLADGSRDFKRDRDGNIATTKLEETALRTLAEKSGGAYFRVDGQSAALERLNAEMDKLEKEELASKEFLDYDDKFQYFIAVALFLLLIETMLGERKNKFKQAA